MLFPQIAVMFPLSRHMAGRRKAGITIRSTMHLLIAQTAIENDLLLLHDDRDFTNMARAIPELRMY
ncbi:MAG: hypothetical protein WCQ50_00260 [Spirochaetota bacterium]